MRRQLVFCLLCTLAPINAFAQVRAQVYVSGLTNPVAFVQDPSNATLQYVVEQAGRIKVVQNGAVDASEKKDGYHGGRLEEIFIKLTQEK